MNAVSFTQSFDACVGHALSDKERQDIADANRAAGYDWRKAREILLKKYDSAKLDALLAQFDRYPAR